MSQRLHVGKTDEKWYDCVLASPEDCTVEKIEREWLMWSGPPQDFIVGPWKLRVGDRELWKIAEPVVREVLEKRGYAPYGNWVSFYGLENEKETE